MYPAVRHDAHDFNNELSRKHLDVQILDTTPAITLPKHPMKNATMILMFADRMTAIGCLSDRSFGDLLFEIGDEAHMLSTNADCKHILQAIDSDDWANLYLNNDDVAAEFKNDNVDESAPLNLMKCDADLDTAVSEFDINRSLMELDRKTVDMLINPVMALYFLRIHW